MHILYFMLKYVLGVLSRLFWLLGLMWTFAMYTTVYPFTWP